MCGKNGARGLNVQHLVGRDSTFELGLAVNQLLRETIHVMESLQSPESALQLSVQVMIFLVVDLNLHFTFICCPLFALFFQLLFIIFVFFSVGNTTWQDWGPWTQCTASCGLGKEFRARACNQAIPGGNETCPGDATEARNCMSGACPGKTCDHDSISISKY